MRPTLLQIFYTFAKVGACTFGGGYSMLPILQREVVQRQGWAEEESVADYYALSQCSPGLIAVNMAVYVAFPLRGVLGAVMAALGVIAPSVLIILLLASLLQSYAHLPVLAHAFAGVRVAVAALVLQAVYKLYKTGVKDKATIVIFSAALTLGLLNIVNPVLVIVGSAACGIAVQAAKRRAKGGSL